MRKIYSLILLFFAACFSTVNAQNNVVLGDPVFEVYLGTENVPLAGQKLDGGYLYTRVKFPDIQGLPADAEEVEYVITASVAEEGGATNLYDGWGYSDYTDSYANIYYEVGWGKNYTMSIVAVEINVDGVTYATFENLEGLSVQFSTNKLELNFTATATSADGTHVMVEFEGLSRVHYNYRASSPLVYYIKEDPNVTLSYDSDAMTDTYTQLPMKLSSKLADGEYTIVFGAESIMCNGNVPNPDGFEAKLMVGGGDAIAQIKSQEKNAVLYDLNGRKVSDGYKGIVIKDGKKILIK